jgi:pyruvate formate lyase activating enzyme
VTFAGTDTSLAGTSLPAPERRRPLLVDVRTNSLDDGPGIRTTVFFKGCPLACVWCHNPEAIDPHPEIAFLERDCIACGECMPACEPRALGAGPAVSFDRSRCNRCGACADACPTDALKRVGRYWDLDDLLPLLLRDQPFYANSGGGVTLSGGEATMFPGYVKDLLRRLRTAGIHTLLETCGLFRLETFREQILPYLDQVYYDVKFIDEDLHRRYTGRPNRVILDNLEALATLAPGRVLPRVPLIPGLTADLENLRAIGSFLRRLGFSEARLLPYNPLWAEKAASVGRASGYRHDGWLARDEQAACEAAFFEALCG